MFDKLNLMLIRAKMGANDAKEAINAKAGMESIEMILIIVIVVLAIVLAMKVFGAQMTDTISGTGNSIAKDACVTAGGTWDAATNKCTY